MKRLGLFLFLESENIVDDYILHMLDDIKPNFDELCIIINNEDCKKYFKKYTEKIIITPEIERGIEIWKDVITNYYGFSKLEKFDEIILFNNSFFGPIYPFKEIFNIMDNVDLDFWTILSEKNHDKIRYPCNFNSCNFQFIAFRNNLIKSNDFQKYWFNLSKIDGEKLNFENVLIDYFTDLGYNWENYLNVINNHLSEREENFYTFNIHELITKWKLPLINIQSFKQPKKIHLHFNKGLDLSLTLDYLKNNTKYDVSLIYKYLLRAFDPNVVVNTLNLKKIIPKDNIDKNYKSNKRIVVICHIYYLDLLDYAFNYLNRIPDYIDIVITTNSVEKKEFIEKNLLIKLSNKSQIVLVNARGRDMAGLFVGCKDIINNYDYFCFMHDKKSAGKEYLTVGASFRDNIWENMLASEDYINSIIKDFDYNENLGLIVPPHIYHGTYFNDYYHNYWVLCFDIIEELFLKMNIDAVVSKKEPPLSIGNCFWAKVDALKPLFDLNLDYDDFPAEPMPTDGTISHALERIYGYVAASQKYYTQFVMTDDYGRSEITNYQYMLGETLDIIKTKSKSLSFTPTPFNGFYNNLGKELTKLNKNQKLINKKNRQIKKMKNSTSWKITRPLRKLTSIFRKLKNKKNTINIDDEYFVSVIMPTYNRKDIISDSIDSVLNQTFKNFELIIVDDGSDDGTADYIKNKYSKSHQIKYFKTDHKGVSYARNFALEKSSGNIIAYLDSDNQWMPEFLETMLKKLKNANCAYCGVDVDYRMEDMRYTLNSKFNRKELLKENFIDINSFIHKKSLYDEYGGFDEDLKRLVDWDLIIRYTKDNKPVHVKNILVNYVLDDSYDTITNSVPLDEYMDIIHEKYWMELYENEYRIIKNYFDEEYYVSEYGGEFSNILTPIHHFLSEGFKEGKNPNKEFVTSFYRNQHKNLQKNEDLNPFVYYIENRRNTEDKINYFDERNKILNTNYNLLSNYKFDSEPLVSIIILNRDGLHHLKRLFKNFKENTNYSNLEVIVVDNASQDNSVEYLRSLDLNINIIENNENVSFAKGNNDAVKIAKGEYILLLNNDIEPTYGWLNEMMGTMIYNDNVASVGAKLIYPYIEDSKNTRKSFSIQHAGDILWEAKDEVCVYKGHNQNKFSKNIFDSEISINKKRLLVTGAVLLVKKSIYESVGGLDEHYWYGYEDIDFNLKVHKAGYDTVFASSALLFHHESATRKEIDRNNHKVFCQKWSDYLFKKLLRDKIEKNYFFTDKKLEFLLVYDSQEYDNYIHDFSKYCIENEYNINSDMNTDNLNVSSDVDIIVSFTPNYNINKIKARKNIIKVLVLSENNIKMELDYSAYDIVIANGSQIRDNIEVLDNFNNLGEDLIAIIYKMYLSF